MESQSSLERIRAWVEGRLDADERARLESELEADAELRAFAESFRAVHEDSEGLDAPLPTSSLDLDELERRIDELEAPPRQWAPWRVASLAAAVLAFAGLLWFPLGRDGVARQREPVSLHTIPLAQAEDEAELELPATLASYHPVSDGRIQWVHEPDEASRIASVTGRPLLVFGRYAHCNVADDVERSMTDDDDLLQLASECVPVVLELDDMPEEEREALIAGGYPCLQLRSADGDSVVCLSSKETGCGLDERMREGIGSCSMKRDCQPWQVSRDLAALSGRAHAAEEAGRLSEAHRLYENLIAGGKGGLFSEAGEQGLHRIALAARDALLEARTVCERDPDGAERLLAEAVERFHGTPHVSELAKVLESLRRTHEFPALAWASY